MEYWNSHKIRRQNGKKMPSGATPRHVFTCPEAYGGKRYSQAVPRATLQVLRDNLIETREESLRWVSDEFSSHATNIYVELGSPRLTLESGWDVFSSMAPLLEDLYTTHS